MLVNHHVVVSNWTLDLWKNSQCSGPSLQSFTETLNTMTLFNMAIYLLWVYKHIHFSTVTLQLCSYSIGVYGLQNFRPAQSSWLLNTTGLRNEPYSCLQKPRLKAVMFTIFTRILTITLKIFRSKIRTWREANYNDSL